VKYNHQCYSETAQNGVRPYLDIRLSRANDGRLEVSGGLLVAPLRGGVGRYEGLSPPDIEVDVGADFGSNAVGAGDGLRVLSGSAAVYSLHCCCFLTDNSQRALVCEVGPTEKSICGEFHHK